MLLTPTNIYTSKMILTLGAHPTCDPVNLLWVCVSVCVYMHLHEVCYMMTSVYISDWCHIGQYAKTEEKDTRLARRKRKTKTKETKASKRFYIFDSSINSKVYKEIKSPSNFEYVMEVKVRNYLNVCVWDRDRMSDWHQTPLAIAWTEIQVLSKLIK